MSVDSENPDQSTAGTSGGQPAIARNKFGTFGGVFTPTILTILGVIMFLRTGYVVGHAGIVNALLILLLAKAITVFTGLSISAISTNTEVRGGGAYFLISRTLGPEFGGAIGVTLFFAQALSVPFYIIGFVEAFVSTFPVFQPHALEIAMGTAALLFTISYVGAKYAIKFQFVVLAVLVVSIVVFMSGLASGFDSATFAANIGWAPESFLPKETFWLLFALYFPAVTGVMAGVNMSGDLENPSRSLPRGTLAAIVVGAVVYGVQMLLMAGSLDRDALIHEPYQSLVDHSLWGAGFMVAAGVFAATISSAIGSFVGAPRILQALARDNLLGFLRPFGQGSLRSDEPRQALWLTLAITATVLWMVGDSGEEALNQVAAIVAMFFLAAYGVTNYAAFVEARGANPSFRPRFRFFHWSFSFVGAVGCIGAALLIDFLAAAASTLVIIAIYYYVYQRDLSSSFGDARRGFLYTRVRNGLLRLSEMPHDAKNWRPTILVLGHDPKQHENVRMALWLESGRGFVTSAHLMIGDLHDLAEQRRALIKEVIKGLRDQKIPAFVEVTVVPDFDQGLRIVLQSHSLGPLKPNLVLFGWSEGTERIGHFLQHLRCAEEIGMSLLLVSNRGFETLPQNDRPRIDLWWRGQKNGSLMLILAHLLLHNREFAGGEIRVIRMIREGDQIDEAENELEQLVEASRIPAVCRAVVSDRPFHDVLHEQSVDAAVVFLGFQLLPPDYDDAFHQTYTRLLDGLPTTILVRSSGDADLLA